MNKKKVGIISTATTAIIASLIAVEGGYVNHPDDPGGETNKGITKAVAVEYGYTGSMKTIPNEVVNDIYYTNYVVKPGFDKIIEIQPAIGEELVDTGANTGPARPSRWFQISLNSLNRGGRDYSNIVVDGKVGNATITAYKALEQKRGKKKSCELVLKLLDAQQAVYYISLTNLNTFTPGWIDHRVGNVSYDKCMG